MVKHGEIAALHFRKTDMAAVGTAAEACLGNVYIEHAVCSSPTTTHTLAFLYISSEAPRMFIPYYPPM